MCKILLSFPTFTSKRWSGKSLYLSNISFSIYFTTKFAPAVILVAYPVIFAYETVNKVSTMKKENGRSILGSTSKSLFSVRINTFGKMGCVARETKSSSYSQLMKLVRVEFLNPKKEN